jgi:hypothetical protein
MKIGGRWKMDPTLAQDDNIRSKIKIEWANGENTKVFIQT